MSKLTKTSKKKLRKIIKFYAGKVYIDYTDYYGPRIMQ